MTNPQGYNLDATPTAIEHRTDERGRPYLEIRASITRQAKPSIERTIRATGKAREALMDAMRVGHQTTIRGFYQKIPANDDAPATEVVVAYGLPRRKAA